MENKSTRIKAHTNFGAAPQSFANMITFRISNQLEQRIKSDLMRAHPYAFERVGFVYAKLSVSTDGKELIVLANDYEPVSDENYIDDQNVGARINSTAIRKAMQRVLTTGEGAFHIHVHEHNGIPGLSYTDRKEIRPLIHSVRNASPQSAHGLVVLSKDAAYVETLLPKHSTFSPVEKVITVGFAMKLLAGNFINLKDGERFSRQTFLGSSAELNITNYRIGIVGLGGGGSHIAQQLAHVGFQNFVLFDLDTIENSNLNRLVGGTKEDVKNKTAKVEVAARLIHGVNPDANVKKIRSRWQDAPDFIKCCDIVFGCVDSYAERRDIEIATRRYLIPYIDIGLDVYQSGDEPPRMAGQVILSMPGDLCMSCMGFLTKTNLEKEAEKYGIAGPRPQVIWANGVLASSAVGIAIDLITDWTQSLRGPVYLSYDSNTSNVHPHKRLQYLQAARCTHFPLANIGDPTFNRL